MEASGLTRSFTTPQIATLAKRDQDMLYLIA